MKKLLSMLLVAIMLLCLMPTTSVFAASVTMVDAVNIELPVAEEKPDFSADLPNWSDAHKITGVEWVEYDEGWEWEKDMSANDTFKEGYWYVVYVHFETTSGNKFSETINPHINNETAQISGPAVQANRTKVSIYKAYQATKATTAISKVDLNVVKPVVGKTPTFAKVDTTQYFSEKYGTVSNCSNGVTWTNQSNNINITVNNPFKEGSKYTVTYYLTAKDGYEFTTATQCIINGAAATLELIDKYHAKVSLKNIVPGDGKKEVSSVSIYVTAPKEGEKPDYTKIDETEYYTDNGINGTSTKIYKNGIAWYKSASSYISPGTTETFKGGTEYTVKIALTPKDGYKFAKSLTAKINGKTATVETFDDGSVNVSVKLTALSKEHKHTNSDWKNDKENHWKICTAKNCGTITVEKEAHKDKNKDNKCDVCGYAIPKEETPSTSTPTTSDTPTTGTPSTDTTPSDSTPTTSEPQTSTPEVEPPQDTEVEDATQDVDTDTTDDNQDDESSAWIWIVVAAVVVLGGCAVVAIVLIKKKK